MNNIVLSIGSNSKDKSYQIDNALKWLSSFIKNYKCSSVYSTLPISGIGDSYLNCVVSGEVSTDIISTTQILKQYEQKCGRIKESKTSITIDIDIVIFNNDIIKLEKNEIIQVQRKNISKINIVYCF